MLDRPSTVSGRADFDLTAKILRHWGVVYNLLVDWHGYPVADISRLGDARFIPDENGRRPPGSPRLLELRGPGWEGGWCCLGNGAQGKDLADMIIYLSGGCERRVAMEYLSSLADRLVEIAA